MASQQLIHLLYSEVDVTKPDGEVRALFTLDEGDHCAFVLRPAHKLVYKRDDSPDSGTESSEKKKRQEDKLRNDVDILLMYNNIVQKIL